MAERAVSATSIENQPEDSPCLAIGALDAYCPNLPTLLRCYGGLLTQHYIPMEEYRNRSSQILFESLRDGSDESWVYFGAKAYTPQKAFGKVALSLDVTYFYTERYSKSFVEPRIFRQSPQQWLQNHKSGQSKHIEPGLWRDWTVALQSWVVENDPCVSSANFTGKRVT